MVWLRSGLGRDQCTLSPRYAREPRCCCRTAGPFRAALVARDPAATWRRWRWTPGELLARRGRRAGIRPGELVVAVGHPLGVAYAAALGVVHRSPNASRARRLAPGRHPARARQSGGPLADAAGRIVGINAMIVGGLGIAVPTHVVERFVHRDRSARAAELGGVIRVLVVARRSWSAPGSSPPRGQGHVPGGWRRRDVGGGAPAHRGG